jgi:hypothetical protein
LQEEGQGFDKLSPNGDGGDLLPALFEELEREIG